LLFFRTGPGYAMSVVMCAALTTFAALDVRIAVVGNAVVDIADAFLHLLGGRGGCLMFVATETGELHEIPADKAGCAGGNMRAGQREEPGMV
jgi:adenine deaminase